MPITKLALDNNKFYLSLNKVGLFADGVAVKLIALNQLYSLIKEWIDDVVNVSVDEQSICTYSFHERG